MKLIRSFLRLSLSEAIAGFISGQARLASLVGPKGRLGAASAEASQARHVLVVHLFEIGDVVMLIPFLRELRRFLPSAQITLVVKPEAKNLVENCPYVSEVLTYQANYRPVWRPFLLPWQAFWTMRRWRRTRRFDLALVPSWQADNSYAAFLACFSGAEQRAGYSEMISPRRRRLNRGFDRLYTQTLFRTGLEHEVERNLAVLTHLGGTAERKALELWTTPEDDAFARDFWAEQGLAGPVVALCPTAGHSALKQWPLERFAALTRRLQEEDVSVVIVGGPGDTALGAALEAEAGGAAASAVGKTTLRQMAALLRRCVCFVGSDAGPMHVAAAAGVPVTAVFGSSCPHRYGPWGADHAVVSHSLPCSPCGRSHDAERCVRCIFPEPRCLTGISVEEVFQEVFQKVLPHLHPPAASGVKAALRKNMKHMKHNAISLPLHEDR